MTEHSAVAVFDNLAQAQQALDTLNSKGIPKEQATIVAHELESKQELHGLVSGTDQNVQVGFGGAVTGAAIGLVLGLIVIGGAALTPYGKQFGIAILAGGIMGFVIAGVVFGALIGSMMGRGRKLQRIQPYDEKVRAGKSLVIAHGSHDQMTKAESILRAAGASEAKVHHHVLAPTDTTEAV